MGALDLALDVAYHDGPNLRDLAVAAEAWTQAGYNDGSIMVRHASADETLDRVTEARKYRHRQLLRAEARGVVRGFMILAKHGVITHAMCAQARNDRWRNRGGHKAAAPSVRGEAGR
jgi:hypothetical protein